MKTSENANSWLSDSNELSCAWNTCQRVADSWKGLHCGFWESTIQLIIYRLATEQAGRVQIECFTQKTNWDSELNCQRYKHLILISWREMFHLKLCFHAKLEILFELSFRNSDWRNNFRRPISWLLCFVCFSCETRAVGLSNPFNSLRYRATTQKILSSSSIFLRRQWFKLFEAKAFIFWSAAKDDRSAQFTAKPWEQNSKTGSPPLFCQC
jgi:hypothetical protein